MFEKLFGNMFDFNRDGHTDVGEAAVGFAIVDEVMKEEESKAASDSGSFTDSDSDAGDER